jgi:hypothetical protein
MRLAAKLGHQCHHRSTVCWATGRPAGKTHRYKPLPMDNGVSRSMVEQKIALSVLLICRHCPRTPSTFGPNIWRNPSIGHCSHIGIVPQSSRAHHWQTDAASLLETASKVEGPFGSLASRGGLCQLGHSSGSQSPVSVGERASGQPRGVQCCREPLSISGEDQLSVSNRLCPFRRHAYGL